MREDGSEVVGRSGVLPDAPGRQDPLRLGVPSQDQVFECFKEWQAEVENYTGQRVKTLRTDNGGEFTSKSFTAHLKACGIRHELTVPKTPEQNGVAERLNRTLVETTRAMLLDAKLPHKFWAEAISTAAYFRNRSPTSAVEGTTPRQAWYGQKPRVEHLRIFGCAAYVHVPKDERGKLDSKTKKCVLLGYGSVQKGYQVYDHLTQKVFYSRNVKFDERETERPPVEEEESAQRPLILDSVDELSPTVKEATKRKVVPVQTHLLPMNTHLAGLPERGDQWTTTVFQKLTSRFTVNPPLLMKQLPVRRKPSGTKPWPMR